MASIDRKILVAIEIDYVDDCQRTLREIRTILLAFERKGKANETETPGLHSLPGANRNLELKETSSHKTTKRSNFFQRLSWNDLKWPLSKSKTTELIRRLERHKATCIIALSAGTV